MTALLRGCVAASRAFQRTWGTVHPHARGEQSRLPPKHPASIGSSPRTWGTGGQGITPLLPVRFIPTHVGNRLAWPHPSSTAPVHPHARGEQGDDRRQPADQCAVHPHARGEQVSWTLKEVDCAGSSPRTWGTGLRGQVRQDGQRFIPTHVGNSGEGAAHGSARPVHPHARGEQCRCTSTRPKRSGSSPRTWGTVRQRIHGAGQQRFIPTHVGNSGSPG